jgi:hypothetical protein
VADDDVLWGAAWQDDEFRWSNLHDEADGMWALGRDMRRSLPGLFWLNAFGPPYVDMIGHDSLTSRAGPQSFGRRHKHRRRDPSGA